MMWALLAIGVSGLCILTLCWGDPKRIRSTRAPRKSNHKATRWALSVAACLPGVGLAWIGDSPAFLTWLGGCAVVGWSLALGFNQKGADTAP